MMTRVIIHLCALLGLSAGVALAEAPGHGAAHDAGHGTHAAAPAAPASPKSAESDHAPAPQLTGGKPFLTPGSRILKTFDFEEKPLGNFDIVPMFWNKVAGRGFPLYTGGRFDEKIFRSSGTSFRMDLDGGSVAYRLAPGMLPLNPNADYYIVGFVRTSGIKYARAEISAWFADENGQLIADSEVHTERYASSAGNNEWKLIYLFMPGMNPRARSLVLQMGLLQPQQLNTLKLGKFDLFRQDIKGSAWFDDITIFQLPRLSIGTKVTGNIFQPGQRPEFDLTVSDLDKSSLKTSVDVQDANQRTIFSKQWSLATDPGHPWTDTLKLDPLPPGFYTATLNVVDSAGMTTRRVCRFITLSALQDAAMRATDFAIDADNWPVDAWGDLPSVLSQAGVGLIKLPAWRRDMSEESLLRNDQPFDQLVATCQRQEIETLASFSEVPSVLTQKLNDNGDSVLSLLDADAGIWRPYVSFILARYAARINLWQIGRPADPFHSDDPRYSRLYTKTYGELSSLLSTPHLVIPWNAMYDFDAKQFPNAILDLRIPALIRPEQVPLYINSFQSDGKTSVIASIEPIDDAAYSRAERIADFVQRIVLARSASPRAVMIDLPMDYAALGASHQSEPTELLMIYRTLARSLGGTTFKRELTLAPGVRALLFDRKGVGTLVLFNESFPAAEATLTLPLGPNAILMNLSGVRTPLAHQGGISQVSVTATPVFIDNLNTHWAEMIGSFSLTRSIAPCGAGIFETTAIIENPFAEALSGSIQFLAPKGWAIDPASSSFSIPPGGKVEKNITLRYPYAEFAGLKTLGARIKIEGDTQRPQDIIEVSTPVTLSSEQVQMNALAHFMPTGELVIQHTITNVGTQPLNAQAYALVPGKPRQQRYILDLQPGQTTIKRFMFTDAKDLVGKNAVLGLRQNDGTNLMTKAINLN